MPCNKCKKNKCCCSSSSASSSAQLQAQVDELQETVNDLVETTKFLKRHPILIIQNADDIALFDPTTKLGSGDWEGWAMCVGGTHYDPIKKVNFTTPNLVDRFVVMATGSYAVNAVGGSNTVALTANQNGQHTHSITDTGHTHNITDPGHNHGVTDNGHTHTGTAAPHTHTFTTDAGGSHSHEIPELVDLVNDGGAGATAANSPVTNGTTGGGEHTHSGTTDSTGAVLTVNNSNTGVAVNNAFIGITETDSEVTGITIANSGAGDAHENRPPFYALIFVQKVY